MTKISEEPSRRQPQRSTVTRIYCVMAAPFIAGAFLIFLPGRYGIFGSLTILAAAPLFLLSFPKKKTGKIIIFLLSATYLAIGTIVFTVMGNDA